MESYLKQIITGFFFFGILIAVALWLSSDNQSSYQSVPDDAIPNCGQGGTYC